MDDQVSPNLCIICNEECNEKQKNPALSSWMEFKDISKEWKDVDGIYKDVYERVNWESSAFGHLWHKNCKWKMANKKSLEQARKKYEENKERKQQEKKDNVPPLQEKKNEEREKKETRKSIGTIHQKDLCIWCMQGMFLKFT